MNVRIRKTAKQIKEKLTPRNLLIAIGLTLFIGRTLDIFDPYGIKYKIIIDWLSAATALLFLLFIYVAFTARKQSDNPIIKR